MSAAGTGFDHLADDPGCGCVFCWCERLDRERATVADDEDNRGAFAFGKHAAAARSPRLVPSLEHDFKLAEVIGMCMGAMTADGLHAVLCEAVLRHQADDERWCEACRGRRPE